MTTDSSTRRRRRVGAFACSALAFALAVGSSAMASSSSSDSQPPERETEVTPEYPTVPSGAELEDLTTAARDQGIAVEDAILEIGWRDNFTTLMEEFRTSLPSDFTRAEIVDGTNASVHFASALPTEAATSLAAFVEAFPHVSVKVVENRGFNGIELNEAVMAAHYAAFERSDVTEVVTRYQSRSGRIVVSIMTPSGENVLSPSVAETIEEELRSAPEYELLSSRVELVVEVLDEPLNATKDSWSWHYGGETVGACTSGFGTRSSSSTSGTRGISTAGHCANTGLTDDGRTLTYQAGHDGFAGDFQWHTGPGSESNKFYAGTSGGAHETNLRSVTSVATALVGNYVCTNGRISRQECDFVYEVGVCKLSNCNLFAMTVREHTSGDSGAPVFNANQARGLHEGGGSLDGANRDWRSQVVNMPPNIGAYVATN